jgi:hypothetical protein
MTNPRLDLEGKVILATGSTPKKNENLSSSTDSWVTGRSPTMATMR